MGYSSPAASLPGVSHLQAAVPPGCHWPNMCCPWPQCLRGMSSVMEYLLPRVCLYLCSQHLLPRVSSVLFLQNHLTFLCMCPLFLTLQSSFFVSLHVSCPWQLPPFLKYVWAEVPYAFPTGRELFSWVTETPVTGPGQSMASSHKDHLYYRVHTLQSTFPSLGRSI